MQLRPDDDPPAAGDAPAFAEWSADLDLEIRLHQGEFVSVRLRGRFVRLGVLPPDSRMISSDGGGLLRAEVAARTRILERLAAQFTGHRDPELIYYERPPNRMFLQLIAAAHSHHAGKRPLA